MVIPGLMVGWIVWIIYHGIFGSIVSRSWLPDTIQDIALDWFPSLLMGMVGGAVAMTITARIFKRSEYGAVAYASGAVWLTLVAAFIIWNGFPDESIGLVATAIGIMAGFHGGRPN